MYRYSPAFLFFFFSFTSYSQNELGTWLSYKNTLKLNSKTSINTQVQHRSFSLDLNDDQGIFITGITHTILPNVSLAAGYRRLKTATFLENGIYQKIGLSSSLGKLGISNTIMLEERWINDSFVLRYRIGLGLRFPLTKRTALLLTEEAFLQNKNNSFDQNRLTTQLSHKLSKSLQLNTGIMHWQFSTLKRWAILCSLHHSISLKNQD